jgi:hypothetical protein
MATSTIDLAAKTWHGIADAVRRRARQVWLRMGAAPVFAAGSFAVGSAPTPCGSRFIAPIPARVT